MTLNAALELWQNKKRKMGCVAAHDWLCARVDGFQPLRKRFYYPNGNDKNGLFWEHVVASNGFVEIDIAPYANKSKEGINSNL